jgi:cytochrome c biogenesis protein CcdA/thiol-disulfide isomerase/thioredoxin
MILLLLFAVVAGAGTAITPCVLPVLPALLSASALGGRRRPLGIVVGLAITFTIAIVALAQIVKGVGLASGAARTFAVIVLISFGAVMLVPELAMRLQAPLSRLARFGPRTRGSGFWSGVGVGGALGFVCAPCAGPILAAVISVSASGNTSARAVAVAIAYVLGLSAVLMLYAIGGRRLADVVRRKARAHTVERALGVVLLATGVLMATNLDVRFENALAKATTNGTRQSSGLLAFLVDPTRSLENSSAVQNRLRSLRPESRFAVRQRQAAGNNASSSVTVAGVAIPGVQTPSLANLGSGPEFTGNQQWFNTPGNSPLTLAGLRGHVVLIDFWTYTCINCIRTLPFLKGLYATYHPSGLEIVGVETPEFTFEQDASNVRQAIQSDGLRYPVVQDNNYGTWNAYQNQYWPAEYLIDSSGNVRHTQFGEGNYLQDEAAVRALLVAAGASRLPPPMTARAIMPSAQLATPETYLDEMRAQGFAVQPKKGVHDYPSESSLQLNEFALQGSWKVDSESATPVAPGASIKANFQADKLYLVMTSAGNIPRAARVLLDGHSIPAADAGADVHSGSVRVQGQRLYSLVSLPGVQQHVLTVELPQGIAAYDFTFG